MTNRVQYVDQIAKRINWRKIAPKLINRDNISISAFEILCIRRSCLSFRNWFKTERVDSASFG